MSKPKDDWWANAVNMVRNYPARKAEYDELHRVSLSAFGNGMPSNTDISRSTERISLREMPLMKQKEYEAVTRAIETTKRLPDGDKRLELIKRMYWSGRKLNIGQVIYQLGISEATGKRWHGYFIRLVGRCAGYELQS